VACTMRHAVLLLLAVYLLAPAVPVSAAAQTDSTPRYVIYYNSDASPPETLVGTPYTHVILSFITVAADAPVEGPVQLDVPDKLAPALEVVARLRAEGKRVLISFGGGDMHIDGYRGLAGRTAPLAEAIAAFVRRHGLDGVDLDFEVSEALQVRRPPGMLDGGRFLIDLTAALRRRLPQGALISHAPQAPYLSPDWHGGPYLDVLREAGPLIDWITVQYYNNPAFDAPTAARVVGEGRRQWDTSYIGFTDGAAGLAWPSEKMLVGLPVYRDDASSGHLPPDDVLRDVVCPLRARFGDGFGGLTGWQFSKLTRDHRFWNGPMAPAVTGSGCGQQCLSLFHPAADSVTQKEKITCSC